MKNKPISAMPKTHRGLTTLTVLLAIGVFVLDLQIPLGVAGGVPYIIVVLLSRWLPGRRDTWIAAGGASVLTILGLFFSPEAGGIMWMVLFNRFLALLAIWVTAFFCLESKRAEAEREELITILEAQNAELERFTYTISHDLKSPLITIKGYLGVLEQDVAKGNAEEVKKDFDRIAEAADKMSELLRNVLELSRIGRLINEPEDVALTDLVNEALELVSSQIADGNVQIDVASDLPVFHGDPVRLREVLQNLIENAVKYTSDQTNPRIEIGSRRLGDETVCFVRDNGIGVEPCHHERIFGLFDQLDQNVEGSGVGLALSKRIIDIHGERIWVESDGLGCGSTFCFSVSPAVDPRASALLESVQK